jgi:hypothetical protein
MGVVYDAIDHASRARVALKVLPRERSEDERLRVRFEREGQAAAAISHENVVRVLFQGMEGGFAVIALEYLEGGTLRSKVKAGPTPWRDVARLGAEIARGLAAVHAAGIVHRDLKPENVLLDGAGRARITDFGLVRGASAGQDQLTRTNELLGTVEYFAPEQANDARQADPRADLYSLGAVLYALLVGRPPFQGTGLTVLQRIFDEAPEPPGKLVPGVPPRLERLVLRLLAKNRADRPKTAGDVAEELEAIRRGDPGKGAEPGSARSRLLLGALALVLFLGGAVGGALVVGRGAPPPPPPPALPEAPPPPAPAPLPRPPKAGSGAGAAERQRDFELVPPDGPRFDWTHAKAVDAVAISPDERWVASASRDGVVKLWDLEQGVLVRSFTGLSHLVLAVVFSPDGRWLLAAGERGQAPIYSVPDGALLKVLQGDPRRAIRALAWGAGGRILTGEADDTKENKLGSAVRIWDFDLGTSRASLTNKAPWPNSVAFVGDGSGGEAIVGYGARIGGYIWNFDTDETGQPVVGDVCGVASSKKGDRLAFVQATRDRGEPRLWLLEHPAMSAPLRFAPVPTPDRMLGVALMPDASRMLVVGDSQMVLVDPGRTPAERALVYPFHAASYGVALFRDGRRALTSHVDGRIRLWKLPD